MRGNLDFSSWRTLASTLFGLVLITLIAVGIRLVFMQTLQRRRKRENRQINERLRTLIAAHKTLGGSFTGELGVDPSHFWQARQVEGAADMAENTDSPARTSSNAGPTYAGSERRRRIRRASPNSTPPVPRLPNSSRPRQNINLLQHVENYG